MSNRVSKRLSQARVDPLSDDEQASKRRKLSDDELAMPLTALVQPASPEPALPAEADTIIGQPAIGNAPKPAPTATSPVAKKRGRPSKADLAARALLAKTQPPELPKGRRHSSRLEMDLASKAMQTDEVPGPVSDTLQKARRASEAIAPADTTSRSATKTVKPAPSTDNGAPIVKRGPGRPRKIKVEEVVPVASAKTSTGKPKGRPRKHPLPVQAAPPTQTPPLSPEKEPQPPTSIKRFKIKMSSALAPPLITHPFHAPLPAKFDSLDAYLASFVSLDEDVTPEVAQQKTEAYRALRQQIEEARAQGLLEDKPKAKAPPLKAVEPAVPQSHQDILSSQACYFSKLMQDERRRNLSNARKIAGMVQQHFKRISGADERLEKDLLKVQRALAKKAASEIRRKWRLAEKEVQRRVLLQEQAQQRALGKEHLNQILEHSTSLLDARRKLHDIDEADDNSSEAGSDDEDHYLSVEQLREKYAHIPAVEVDSRLPGSASTSEAASDDGHPEDSSGSDREEDSDADSEPMDSEMDESEAEADEGPGLSFLYPELVKPPRAASLSLTSNKSDPSDADMADDSPMDSEMDSGSEASASDGPGLAALYPELRKVERDSSSVDAAEVNSAAQLTLRTSKRQSSEQLVSLPSDEEVEEGDDSPMDSELEDVESGSDVSEASSGPGLAYLYAMPAVKSDKEVVAPAPKAVSPPAIEELEQAASVEQLDIKTPIPALLRGTLREYQHIGLDWMAGLYLNGTNGILADEMGLGKTIQTISLLTWLACERQIWGPHLIIVPTSVMLNWEREFKKFAPGLKVLTYYGNPKERKEKRRGWSKPDSFHVIITSYQLVISDQATFRRRRWEYMILDEAHNIKNFKSQRWQTLLNFNTAHRLLLTGTPLQNNLNELWSLLYFLMPQGLSEDASFANLSDFQEWFGRPVDKLIEDGTGGGMSDEARNTVAKLHRILRPYILRRLKADVEKQMPGKFEHVIECRLSKRQRFLYDDFMSRAKTRETLASGNFLSIINCFMQLRKVCNHPDLFESRPIVTSFAMHRSAAAAFETQDLLVRRRLLAEQPGLQVDLNHLNLILPKLESSTKVEQLAVHRLALSVEVPPAESPFKDDHTSLQGKEAYLAFRDRLVARERALHQRQVNTYRTQRVPVYGADLVRLCRAPRKIKDLPGYNRAYWRETSHMAELMPAYKTAVARCEMAVRKFGCITPKVLALDLPQRLLPLTAEQRSEVRFGMSDAAHFSRTCTSIAFPDKRLLQFDCGKLQRLDMLLRDLLPQGHRVLIFTQMTRMLDILEQFLNIHGHRYFRLDGATKIEQRQHLTERFNNDPRIPVFILSTRSGGLGINLTGANVVIFFDSDWNPCMDRQCQDRAHRIGQTRDVHIYRFVSSHTIEQNIMRKANQKRMLDNVVIGQGDFTTDFFNKVDWRDMLGEELAESLPAAAEMEPGGGDLEATLAMVEDEEDAAAARVAEREMDVDAVEFAETNVAKEQPAVAVAQAPVVDEEDDELGSVDDYMIQFLLRESGRLDLLTVG